jgi:hypothetical protein
MPDSENVDETKHNLLRLEEIEKCIGIYGDDNVPINIRLEKLEREINELSSSTGISKFLEKCNI